MYNNIVHIERRVKREKACYKRVFPVGGGALLASPQGFWRKLFRAVGSIVKFFPLSGDGLRERSFCHSELVSEFHYYLEDKKLRRYEGRLLSENSLSSNPPTLLSSNNHSVGNASLIPTYELKKRAAFTLAEVLITLGIIGIVAALTMPALIANHQKKTLESQFKKAYSMLKNAELRAVAAYGLSEDWDYEDADVFMNTYYVPYLNVVPMKKVKDYSVKSLSGVDLGTWYMPAQAQMNNWLYLVDGMLIRYFKNHQYFILTVDVNGSKAPNIYGKDIWDFELLWDGPKKLTPKGLYYGKPMTKEGYSNIYNNCKNYVSGNGGGCQCTGPFIYNNYKFDKNYPW